MAGFEKVLLATGEPRADYIRRRLQDGADVKTITAEINAPQFFTGPAGARWAPGVVYAEQSKLKGKPARSAVPAVSEPAAADAAEDEKELKGIDADIEVPAEFEGILDAKDMAEIKAEAALSLRKKDRAAARKAALAKVTAELEREARLAMQRGVARRDMVDIHIDLAPYAPNIRLDGQTFEHGRTYRVPRQQYAVLSEQMQRTWQHQEGLNGKNERPYRRTLIERGITANGYQAAMVRA
jgi:hypothetical protein